MIEIEDVIEPTPTCEESKKINAIDKETVHKICSGQVVLNLAIAVKELVENSLDAGATIVEIKLKEHGSELVEVCDNGSGVEERNFVAMTAKYHTSKLKEFSDLACIETFGFRGEALSSLCALADMVIITRHELAAHGTKLHLDNHGVIIRENPCARSVGTTVSLSNLFATLPVRRKEFQKNIKKEFIKMCHILQAYCLVSVGVRIICTNQNKKGVKSVVMSTQGTGQTVLDNITTVFGAKQTAELVQLKPAINSSGKIMDLNASDFDDSLSLTQEEVDSLNLSRYNIEGYVSSCAHGSGRSSKDRQFFYINSRPCEPVQIIKLINETYHKYNTNQNPFVYLNLKMDRSDVDVNLTPDKRQILVNNEKILLLALKKSLIKTYGCIPSTYKVQNVDVSATSRLLNISIKSDKEDHTEEENDSLVIDYTSQKLSETFSQWKATVTPKDIPSPIKVTGKRKREIIGKMEKIQPFLVKTLQTAAENDLSFEHKSDFENMAKMARNSTMVGEEILETGSEIDQMQTASFDTLPLLADNVESMDFGSSKAEEVVELIKCKNISPNEGNTLKLEIKPEGLICMEKKEHDFPSITFPREPNFRLSSTPNVKIETIEVETTDIETSPQINDGRTIDVDMNALTKILSLEQKLRQADNKEQPSLTRLKFKSKINPSNNRAAEDELQTEISRTEFPRMDIIGQFNLGFIVVRLDQDMFIIDQHASDEKFNFEDLQKNTVLQNQKLVVPQQLELTAVNEMILMDNLEIFEMNGFKFEIDGAAEPTKKVKLLAKPYSKNWEFGKEDIDELVFMLQDAPNSICRPSRVKAMFASRACRKSVMIGNALSMAEMRRLINHMGEIEQPWNCPHGRPTMRHLINLSMIAQTASLAKENE
ncbi:mismatch repair endonuclease PMS2 [Wyeomyia smithii]|uniref:mismatch repair endonuclease PMS2 n=1 Tax=Wyeomyia smithii TaxID=174621 RepID=UPI002467ACE6|nr:mismatch repair endonuclease PMS2 [Wyeomyia smithii]